MYCGEACRDWVTTSKMNLRIREQDVANVGRNGDTVREFS
jgi:hypothetical protein